MNKLALIPKGRQRGAKTHWNAWRRRNFALLKIPYEGFAPFNQPLRGFGAFLVSFNEPLRGFWTFQVSFNDPLRGLTAFQVSFNDPLRGFEAFQASFKQHPPKGSGFKQGPWPRSANFALLKGWLEDASERDPALQPTLPSLGRRIWTLERVG